MFKNKFFLSKKSNDGRPRGEQQDGAHRVRHPGRGLHGGECQHPAVRHASSTADGYKEHSTYVSPLRKCEFRSASIVMRYRSASNVTTCLSALLRKPLCICIAMYATQHFGLSALPLIILVLSALQLTIWFSALPLSISPFLSFRTTLTLARPNNRTMKCALRSAPRHRIAILTTPS